MKKYILTLACVLGSLAANASDFSAQIGDQYNKITWYFDWVDEAHTMCQTASADGISFEYGPNQYNASQYEWHIVDKNGNIKNSWDLGSVVPNEINWIIVNNGFPSEVEYNGKMIPIVAIGDFSFTGRVNGAVTIPETITKIGKGAFYNANQTITLHDKITYIDDFAFYGDAFPSIELNNLEKLGSYAFAKCTQIEKIKITNTEEIGDHAFFGIQSIKSVHLENVKKVGEYAFTGFEGEGWHSSTCGNGSATTLMEYLYLNNVEHIGNYAFAECHKLKEINIPNSVNYIGDYAFFHCQEACPIVIGDNVEYIGSWAFSGGTYHTCSETLISLPGSLKTIGDHAFTFNNESGVFKDLNINSSTPPTMILDEDGCSAFGYLDPTKLNRTFFNDPAAWIYPYVCLHVPIGSYQAYASDPEWSKFTCIVDDLIPTEPTPDGPQTRSEEDPMSYIMGYVYLVPEDAPVDLAKDVLHEEDVNTELDWELVGEDDGVITLKNGVVTPNKFGTKIVMATRKGNEIFDGSTFVDAGDRVVGAVVVFVCPTITLVSDKTSVTDETTTPAETQQRVRMREQAADAVTNGEAHDIDKLKRENSTYEHRVVYDSYPKLQVNPANTIEIEVIERAKIDENNNYVDNGELQELDEAQYNSSNLQGYEGAVVPLNPVQENRVVVVSIAPLAFDGTTGVKETQINSNISVTTASHLLTITGAAEDSVVRVVNLQGQTVYQGIEKSIELDNGIYIISVEDVVFKAIVR